MALHQLGEVAHREDDAAEAVRLVGAALALRRDVGDREDLAISLEALAGLVAADDGGLAARLFGAAETLRARHRLPQPAGRDVAVARLKSTVDDRVLATAWAAGQSAPLDSVVDEALDRVAAYRS